MAQQIFHTRGLVGRIITWKLEAHDDRGASNGGFGKDSFLHTHETNTEWKSSGHTDCL